MTVAVVLDAASIGLRWWAGIGLHPLPVGLSTAGLAIVLVGAYLPSRAISSPGR
jgi:hypothetical protein